jgi:hypothetical protein
MLWQGLTVKQTESVCACTKPLNVKCLYKSFFCYYIIFDKIQSKSMASLFGIGTNPLMRSITTIRWSSFSSFRCLPSKTIIRNYYYSRQNDPPDWDKFEIVLTIGVHNRRIDTLNTNPNPGGGQNYVWHSAKQIGGNWKSPVAAVDLLIGWVGSEQRHLRAFVEWYMDRGMHAITVCLPMGDLLSYYMGSRAQ